MKTKRRIPLLKKMLKQFGIEEERVRLDWVSASEGDRFAAIVDEMTEQVRQLGPLNHNGSDHSTTRSGSPEQPLTLVGKMPSI